MRKLTAATAALAAALVLTGCGGDDGGGGGSAIAEADFIAQANQICQTGNAALTTAFTQLPSAPTAEDLQAFFVDSVIPNIREQMADIRALGFPDADQATLDAIFDQVGQVLDAAQADPASMVDPTTDEFAEVNAKLTEYGLTTGGESDQG